MSPEPLVLLPAVDVSDGRAVRMVQAAEGSAVAYGDPLATALGWQAAGAQWVHLVDLDAAFGRGSNAAQLATIVGTLDVAVQLSGGIADDASLSVALATGCARVNLSSAALVDLDWVADAVARHGERIAIGLDVLGDRLRPRGTQIDVGNLSEVLASLDEMGCRRYVVTDVQRDGALTGPNVELLRRVCQQTSRPVVASGGVSDVADVAVLRRLVPEGVEGVIVGQALYTGGLTIEAALAAAGADGANDRPAQ